MEILFIDAKPILHVVDESKRYQSAIWLETVSSESIWLPLGLCWIDVYMCPPEVIAHDAGKNFISRRFQTNADLIPIESKAIPVE